MLAEAWRQHRALREDDAPTVISTFAGAGGSSLGYSMTGFREVLAVEFNQNAEETLAANFEGLPVFAGDIRGLTVKEALKRSGIPVGELDVLDGSPPCQGFSTAGRRNLEDSRNSLFREYVRLLRGLKPKAFVMENVSGMVKGKMRLVFTEALRELKASGYRVSARLMNTMYFDVPQNRPRLIFVGVREDLGIEPTHPRAERRPFTVRDAIGGLPLETQSSATGHVWIDESPEGRNTATWPLANRCPQGRKYAGQQKRDTWTRPASTLTTNGVMKWPYLRGMNCHPLATRTYSVLEYRRLASFPDEFVFAGSAWDVLPRVGNAVPPLFMRAVARHIRKSILCIPEEVSHGAA